MRRGQFSRRDWLRRTAQLAGGLPLVGPSALISEFLQRTQPAQQHTQPAPQRQPVLQQPSERPPLFENDPTKYRFTRDEDEFLESIERTTFQFFWNETNPVTGLVKDLSPADGTDQRNAASIAAAASFSLLIALPTSVAGNSEWKFAIVSAIPCVSWLPAYSTSTVFFFFF